MFPVPQSLPVKGILQESQAPETRGKVWSKEALQSVKEDKERLNKLDILKSHGAWQVALSAERAG